MKITIKKKIPRIVVIRRPSPKVKAMIKIKTKPKPKRKIFIRVVHPPRLRRRDLSDLYHAGFLPSGKIIETADPEFLLKWLDGWRNAFQERAKWEQQQLDLEGRLARAGWFRPPPTMSEALKRQMYASMIARGKRPRRKMKRQKQ